MSRKALAPSRRRRRVALPAGIAVAVVALFPLSLTPWARAAGTNYYVSCSGGSNSNAGTSPTAAWASLAAINGHNFAAGSVINLAKGCSFDGGMEIHGSATSSARIVVTSYGTGAPPIVSNSGGGKETPAILISSSFITISNLHLTKASGAGVTVRASDAIIQDTEVNNAGFGVYMDHGSDRTKVLRVNSHDLKMVNNTPGGDDDYGAVGYVVDGSGIEIANSICTNCQDKSYDFGEDGGFVEIWEAGDNLSVHGCFANGTNGFMETGGSGGGQHANHIMIADNIIKDTGNLSYIHSGDGFSLTVTDLVYENNTVVGSGGGGDGMFGGGTSVVTARNNIFYSTGGGSWGGPPGHHNNNLYYKGSGFGLSTGEKNGDPLFVNAAGGDFHLQAASPARGGGAAATFKTDYEGKAVGATPDLGAVQFATTTSAPTTATTSVAAGNPPTPTPPAPGDVTPSAPTSSILGQLPSPAGATTSTTARAGLENPTSPSQSIAPLPSVIIVVPTIPNTVPVVTNPTTSGTGTGSGAAVPGDCPVKHHWRRC